MKRKSTTNLTLISKQVMAPLAVFAGVIVLALLSLQQAQADGAGAFNISNVNISTVYPSNGSVIRSIIEMNVTFGRFDLSMNVSNVSFLFVRNTLGAQAFYQMGFNNTAVNLSSYIFRNSTEGMPTGNYSFWLNITNSTGHSQLDYVSNFSIDNSNPVVSYVTRPTINQTNTSIYINYSAYDVGNETLTNCTIFIDGSVVNYSVFSNTRAPVYDPKTSFVQNINVSQGPHNIYVACYDTARVIKNNGVFGNMGQSTSFKLTTDTAFPQFSVLFKDSEGNENTQFTYGSEVTAVCNLSDNEGVNDRVTLNLSVQLPGESASSNVSALTIARTETTYKFTVTDTRQLGDYHFTCAAADYVNFWNRTTGNFSIISGSIGSTSAYKIPGFKEPLAKKVIGEGVINNLGILTESGEARLIEKTGGVVLNINDQDYEIIVKDVTESAATLDVAGTETTINAGESKQFDLNSDSINDLDINLNMVYHKKADLAFRKISVQAQPPEVEKDYEETVEKEPEKMTVEKKNIKSAVTVVIMVIVVVILLVITIAMMRRRRGGENLIKFKPRDLGAGKDQSDQFYSQAAGNQESNIQPGNQPPSSF